ncbi:MAG: hypothetical protein JO102_02610, partial [Elusimicrobia bacterium]|nr:hypothetical protein [Elusimicrobiota bacterium]
SDLEAANVLPLNDAGEVRLSPSAMNPSDFLVAVYAERLDELPVDPQIAATAPGETPTGCLPVVRIETTEGATQLEQPGEVIFGCTDAPVGSSVYVWRSGAWSRLPSIRTADGRVEAIFRDTAVYGLFLPSAEPPRI